MQEILEGSSQVRSDAEAILRPILSDGWRLLDEAWAAYGVIQDNVLRRHTRLIQWKQLMIDLTPTPQPAIDTLTRGRKTQVPATDSTHTVQLSRCSVGCSPRSLAPHPPDARSDLANALLTTVLATGRQRWIARRLRPMKGLIRWPAVDSSGPAKPPEKRKVGGSIPPLTTSFAM
jgi:hypothetical protein